MLKCIFLLPLFLTSINLLPPAAPECSDSPRSSCTGSIFEREGVSPSPMHNSPSVDCVPPGKSRQSQVMSHRPSCWIVKMVGMRFVPEKLEIAAGDSVKWVNESNSYHNTASADGTFISEMLKKGASFQRSFDKPGIFKYYCQPHRWMGMKGQIIVSAPVHYSGN